MNKYRLYYKQGVTQASADIIIKYLKSFGVILDHSARSFYFTFETNLNKQQMESRVKGMKNIERIEQTLA